MRLRPRSMARRRAGPTLVSAAEPLLAADSPGAIADFGNLVVCTSKSAVSHVGEEMRASVLL